MCLNWGFYRTEQCRFSGAKIYPGRGIRFVRADSQVKNSLILKSFYRIVEIVVLKSGIRFLIFCVLDF